MLALLAVLGFMSCKDKEERAFKREERQVEKSISKDELPIIGTWVKDISSADASLPDVMEIKNGGKLAAYEDNDGGELGLDSKKEKIYSWKTEADFFIIDKGWETVTYLYEQEGKNMKFFDETTRKASATYTRK